MPPQTIPLIAKVPHVHNGCARVVGERYEVTPIEAASLTWKGKADFARGPAPSPAPPERATYQRKDAVPEDPAEDKPDADTAAPAASTDSDDGSPRRGRRRREYRRRDLVPEP